MTDTDFDVDCPQEHATRFWDWIQTRGGIAVWRSIDLSDPGATLVTPADATKPHWLVGDKPEAVVTDPARVRVRCDREVKRFHVDVRQGSGLKLELTAASSRRLRQEVTKAGDGAYHVFDYGAYENAVVMAPERTMSLAQWRQEHLS